MLIMRKEQQFLTLLKLLYCILPGISNFLELHLNILFISQSVNGVEKRCLVRWVETKKNPY